MLTCARELCDCGVSMRIANPQKGSLSLPVKGLTMVDRVNRINPVAKAMMQSRRRTQVVPNKKKYNRKRDKHASEDRQVPHQADKQTTDD